MKIEKAIEINVPADFQLLCLIMSCEPEDVVQHYIDNISLPRQMSVHPDDPKGLVTGFFLANTPTCDSEEVQLQVHELSGKDIESRLIEIVTLNMEQADCEKLIRVEVKNWRDEYLKMRKLLKDKDPNYKIVEYGS